MTRMTELVVDQIALVRERFWQRSKAAIAMSGFDEMPACARTWQRTLLLRARERCGQHDVEGRAHLGGALDADGSSKQPNELLGDVQAETGAAVAATVARVDLSERIEDQGLLVLCDPDATVSHGEQHLVTATRDAELLCLLVVERSEANEHATFGGELERVADEVLDDLHEALCVGHDLGRRAVRHVDFELQVLIGRHMRELIARQASQFADAGKGRANLEAAASILE